jgi:hypothetical protein
VAGVVNKTLKAIVTHDLTTVVNLCLNSVCEMESQIGDVIRGITERDLAAAE